MRSRKLIVIAGPTAVGKTEVAIRLAEYFKTEIISADSRQIFRELEIGTAKPSVDELSRVPHHFISSHSITESYDAGAYGREALALINTLFTKYDSLILCGGSGLYLKAVLEGFDDMPAIPPGMRDQIIAEYESKGIAWLQEELRKIDPFYFEEIDKNNPQRLIRAIELFRASAIRPSQLRQKAKRTHDFEVIKIGLELTRDELYKRIDARMDIMITSGLFEEAQQFYGQRHLNALQTVGYREIFDYLGGKISKEETVRLLKRNTRRYAKRQLTWFKRDPEFTWYQPDQLANIIALVDQSKN